MSKHGRSNSLYSNLSSPDSRSLSPDCIAHISTIGVSSSDSPSSKPTSSTASVTPAIPRRMSNSGDYGNFQGAPAANSPSSATTPNNATPTQRYSYSAAGINRTRSLHGPSSTKRWSSSAILEHNRQGLSSLALSAASASGSSAGPTNNTPGGPTFLWMTDQERALQEKLQQLARTENARLKAHEELFQSTASPTKSSADPSPPPISTASPTGNLVPLPFTTSSKRSGGSHQRHLSLQTYHHSRQASDLTGFSDPNTPISGSIPHGFHLPLAASPMHVPFSASMHRHTNSTSSSGSSTNLHSMALPMSPRAVARAAALATLNSEAMSNGDPHHHQQHVRPNSQGPSPLHRSSNSGSNIAVSRNSSLSAGHSDSSSAINTQFTSSFDGEVPQLSLSRAQSLKNRRNLIHSESHTCTDSESEAVPSGVAVPDGYYLISAAEFEKLNGKIDRSTTSTPVQNETLSTETIEEPVADEEPKAPVSRSRSKSMSIQHAIKSWQMSGDIMRNWMVTYKSPAAITDVFALFWTMLTNGEAVQEFAESKDESLTEGTTSSAKKSNQNAGKESKSEELASSGASTTRHVNIRNNSESVGLLRNVVFSSISTGLIMSVIFIQVSLLSVMIMAYVLGDVVTMPFKKSAEYISSYRLKKTLEIAEAKKLKAQKDREERLKSKAMAKEEPETLVVEELVPKDTKEIAAPTIPTVEVVDETPLPKVQKKPKVMPEYVDPSVMLSNALKAKRAALKQAKRRSKH